MRVAVLTQPTSWYFQDLMRAAGGRHELTALPFRQLNVLMSPAGDRVESSGVALSDFDLVLVRTMPPGTLEQVVFRMDVLGRLAAADVPVVNPPRAIEAAVDKYLSTAMLREAGLLTPDTIVCQNAEDALQAFDRLGRDVVLKPLFGSEGRGITRLADEAMAWRAFTLLPQMGAVLYLQRYVEHEGADLRILVIGDRCYGIQRRNPLDWRTNISRGAEAVPAELSPELIDMARAAAAAVGAPLAGVDLLPGRDGRLYCLEVNAVPGWRGLAGALNVDVAAVILEFLEMVASGKRDA